MDQSWHRDFLMPEQTRAERRLTSPASNVTCVDTTDDTGPFNIAPGTHFDDSPEFAHGMFPPRSHYPRYVERAVRKHPQRGDISIRSALTVHRGTKNESQAARPVLVLGLEAPGGETVVAYSPRVTQAFHESLLQVVRDHLHCPVVDELTPIVQQHTIEGLVMSDPGDAPSTGG